MNRILIAAAVLGIIAGAAGLGGWYVFVRGDEPPPVSLESALQSAGTSATASSTPRAEATATAAAAQAAPGTAAVVGTWTVQSSSSFVGYRVQEQLAGIGASTAVGRTSAVNGDLAFDGAQVSAVRVTADLQQLKSDDSRRDQQLRRQALETVRFPEASFVLVDPIPVSVEPRDGASLSAVAKGDLTLHGVTRRVEVSLQGKLEGERLVVVGSIVLQFADFGINAPTAPLVLAVEERAVMELQLVFARG